MVTAVVWITQSARPLAETLAREFDAEAVHAGSDTAETLRALFTARRPIIALCASGILIRILAPLLADKHAEPPVVAVAEVGSAAVPLLGGHHGANTFARRIAEITGGVAPGMHGFAAQLAGEGFGERAGGTCDPDDGGHHPSAPL